MPAPLVVPDASVLLKWILPSGDEPDIDQALLLRAAIVNDAVRAIVPALWLYEVSNTVARRFPAHASAWLTSLMKFGLAEAAPSAAWLAAALELIRTYEVSFYDAAYHALAITRNGLFVTADVRYVNRMAGEGAVVALSEWKAPVPPSSSRR
ncbi:MAG: type II toxin-antitoxin system VapC family toxin [Steroidobacteraceae bacterium]